MNKRMVEKITKERVIIDAARLRRSCLSDLRTILYSKRKKRRRRKRIKKKTRVLRQF